MNINLNEFLTLLDQKGPIKTIEFYLAEFGLTKFQIALLLSRVNEKTL